MTHFVGSVLNMYVTQKLMIFQWHSFCFW